MREASFYIDIGVILTQHDPETETPDLEDDQLKTNGQTDEQTVNGEVPTTHSTASEEKAPSSKNASKSTPKQGATKKRTSSKTSRTRTTTRKSATKKSAPTFVKFPRQTVDRALKRVPKAILDQNAGHACTPTEAAKLLGVTNSGPFRVEVSSAKKYGFLESKDQKLALTDRAKRALRPQTDNDEIVALREAVLSAPDLGEVYEHYRGEYIPDDNFFNNTLAERFKIPEDKVTDFRDVFLESLRQAQLLNESDDRPKVIDIGRDNQANISMPTKQTATSKTTGDTTTVDASCFVMQPFSDPYLGYYDTLFKPAIEKAGLRSMRADAEIFGTGKIMDQVWRGIRSSKVLLAELTTKNANVYYELGLAHSLGKPVVLVAANDSDVPFDLQHIRVIYYDMRDPFWGPKLLDKIAENIRSALQNPEEAIFKVEDI